MRPQLEVLSLDAADRSFNYYNVVSTEFEPFWHFHPEFELTLIHKGEGLRFVGDSILPYSSGDLVLIGENLPHHWVSQGKNDAAVFQFTKEALFRFPECRSLKPLFDEAARGIRFIDPPEAVIRAILAANDLEPLPRLASLIQLLGILCKHTHRETLSNITYNSTVATHRGTPSKTSRKAQLPSAGSGTGNEYQSRVAKTTRHILENLDQNLTVDHMANFTGMVGPSFCRWFKSATGNSFITFLNTARIEKACHLIMHTDWSISEVAFTSGFESISHFNRVFKKVKGTTPTRFRDGS